MKTIANMIAAILCSIAVSVINDKTQESMFVIATIFFFVRGIECASEEF